MVPTKTPTKTPTETHTKTPVKPSPHLRRPVLKGRVTGGEGKESLNGCLSGRLSGHLKGCISGSSVESLVSVPPMCCKNLCVRFLRVAGELWAADPSKRPMRHEATATSGRLSGAPGQSWKPRHQQHPGPENQDSQHMLNQPRGSLPDRLRESMHAYFRALLNGGERNRGYAAFVWQERAQTRATQMTNMPPLKPLCLLCQNQSSLRHQCVICLSQRKNVTPIQVAPI